MLIFAFIISSAVFVHGEIRLMYHNFTINDKAVDLNFKMSLVPNTTNLTYTVSLTSKIDFTNSIRKSSVTNWDRNANWNVCFCKFRLRWWFLETKTRKYTTSHYQELPSKFVRTQKRASQQPWTISRSSNILWCRFCNAYRNFHVRLQRFGNVIISQQFWTFSFLLGKDFHSQLCTYRKYQSKRRMCLGSRLVWKVPPENQGLHQDWKTQTAVGCFFPSGIFEYGMNFLVLSYIKH